MRVPLIPLSGDSTANYINWGSKFRVNKALLVDTTTANKAICNRSMIGRFYTGSLTQTLSPQKTVPYSERTEHSVRLPPINPVLNRSDPALQISPGTS